MKILCTSTRFKSKSLVSDRKPGAVNEGGLLPGGLYLEALCDGLEAALRPYKLTLADVEKEILRTGAGQNTQLSSIQHKVMSFHPMLRGLSHLVQQFELTKPHGCLILDTVYRCAKLAKRLEHILAILWGWRVNRLERSLVLPQGLGSKPDP